MKTPTNPAELAQRVFHAISMAIAILLAFAMLSQFAEADIPDRPRTYLGGIYKVASSTDPMFPMREGQEWFLDFGEGTTGGSISGSVTISLRENPNVKVRIMVWQFFPEQGALLIGNQFERGSRGAVAKAVWSIGAKSDRIVLSRENASVTLKPADRSDY